MGDGAVTALIGEAGHPGVLRWFRRPVRTIASFSPTEIGDALREVEGAVAGGLSAAGFLAYESAPGLDPALVTRSSAGRPLAWFGLFEDSQLTTRLEVGQALTTGAPSAPTLRPTWRPSMDRKEYEEKVGSIKAFLAEGDSYQVNFTFKLHGEAPADLLQMFLDISSDYRVEHSSFVSTEEFSIVSGSPELFFQLEGRRIISRPMKGTERRGLTSTEDESLASSLLKSEKNRAENLMIVDMIRNDLGKICDPGTVRVRSLFDVERFWTVLQMTSTVEGMTSAPVAEIFAALFPCASVTGAPKVRTMQIIRELETAPRGVYTGCIGYLLPGRRAKFSVAIRTAWIDSKASLAEYGVGGGIVWDSSPGAEYDECLLKSRALTAVVPEFDLLETMLWEEGRGYFLLRGHLQRLAGSARFFSYPLNLSALEERLDRLQRSMPGPRSKVRLLLRRAGDIEIQRSPIVGLDITENITVEVSKKTVDSGNIFLFHKTTNRVVYQEAIGGSKCDDVILMNERGEITESTVANIVVEKDGKLVTPPVRCGLLPGTFREELLGRGEIAESVLLLDDLLGSPRIMLINSVQKWIPVTLKRPGVTSSAPPV